MPVHVLARSRSLLEWDGRGCDSSLHDAIELVKLPGRFSYGLGTRLGSYKFPPQKGTEEPDQLCTQACTQARTQARTQALTQARTQAFIPYELEGVMSMEALWIVSCLSVASSLFPSLHADNNNMNKEHSRTSLPLHLVDMTSWWCRTLSFQAFLSQAARQI